MPTARSTTRGRRAPPAAAGAARADGTVAAPKALRDVGERGGPELMWIVASTGDAHGDATSAEEAPKAKARRDGVTDAPRAVGSRRVGRLARPSRSGTSCAARAPQPTRATAGTVHRRGVSLSQRPRDILSTHVLALKPYISKDYLSSQTLYLSPTRSPHTRANETYASTL